MSNPLLEKTALPKFSAINAADIEPAIKAVIDENRSGLNQLLESLQKQGVTPEFAMAIPAIEELGEEEYTKEDIRLMRIKFISELGN